MVNADRYGSVSFICRSSSDVNFITKIPKFHHENSQLLRHPIKFALVDSSKTPEYTTKLAVKATGRISVGAWSKHAIELQNDKKIELNDKEVFLPCHFQEHLHVK